MRGDAAFVLECAGDEYHLTLVALALPAAAYAFLTVWALICALKKKLASTKRPTVVGYLSVLSLTLTLRRRHVSQPLYLPATPTIVTRVSRLVYTLLVDGQMIDLVQVS